MRYIFKALISIGKDANDKSHQGWVDFDEVLPSGLAPGVFLMNKINEENRDKVANSENSNTLRFIQEIRVVSSSPEVEHDWDLTGKTSQGIALVCKVCGAEAERFSGSPHVKLAKWCKDYKFCGGVELEVPPNLDKMKEVGSSGKPSEITKEVKTGKGVEHPLDQALVDAVVELLKKGSKVIKRKVQKSAFVINEKGEDTHRLMPKDFETLFPKLKPVVQEKPTKSFTIYELIK